jgi:hypothetical protein
LPETVLIDADGAVSVCAATGKAPIGRILGQARREAVLPVVVPIPTVRAVRLIERRHQRGQPDTGHGLMADDSAAVAAIRSCLAGAARAT